MQPTISFSRLAMFHFPFRSHILIIVLFLLGTATSVVDARVCGTQWLRRNPDQFPLPAAKVLAPRQDEGDIEVGSERDFVVGGRSFLERAVCQYVGKHCYVFVESAQWDANGGPVLQVDVDFLCELFDHAVPSDAERGIYELATEAFGEPSDVDGDERIFILVTDLGNTNPDRPDLAGFFDPRVAQHPDPRLRRDTIYLDAATVRLRRSLAGGTLAHEFQHLIHWAHDDDEESWVDEGLSGYAEELAGYPDADPAAVPAFLQDPRVGLTNWQKRAYNYGATYLFMSFMAERYGVESIRALVQEPGNGIAGIDEVLDQIEGEEGFEKAWARWIVGNYAVDDEGYGYAALRGRRVLPVPAPRLPFMEVGGAIDAEWGSIYVLFRHQGSLALQFFGEQTGSFHVWTYAMRGGMGELDAVELDPAGQGETEVVSVDSLVLIVGRSASQGSEFELSAAVIEPSVVAVTEESVPQELRLDPVYPNPFNRRALIPFSLPAAAAMELSLYNCLGQRIRLLRQGLHFPGNYQVLWDGLDEDGRELANGTYVALLRSGSKQVARKISLLQ